MSRNNIFCRRFSSLNVFPRNRYNELRFSFRSYKKNVSSLSCSSTEKSIIHELRCWGGGEVSCSKKGKLVEIIFKNYENRNSLTGKMMVEFSDIVSELERDNTSTGLIMRGEGGAFCSGADFGLARDFLVTPTHGAAMCELMTDTLTRLRRLGMVSVAAVEGAAFGGGAELMTACDFRIISQDAKICFVQAKMGVSTGWGGAGRLVQLVGRQQALRLLCWSPKITAQEASNIKLVDIVCDANTTNSTAISFLQPLLDAECAESVAALKRSVAFADDFNLDESRILEKQEFIKVWGAPFNRKKFDETKKRN